MRANEVSALLAAQVEGVVRHLLPKGKKVGQEWQVGSLDGEPGESLSVHVGPTKPGVWSDFATGQSGDLIGLWMAVKGLSVFDACTDALAFMGVRESRPAQAAAPRTYRKPTREGVSTLASSHADWLRDVRKLPDTAVAAYKLASRGDKLMLPYLDPAGTLVFAKYRRNPATTPKNQQFSAEADCEPILFGWQAIPARARSVVICEGELDALAWYAAGCPALSVPAGAASLAWIEREFDRLQRFDAIFLSMDMDKHGQEVVAEICSRLGRGRTFVIRLPHKDANECLMAGMTPAELRECASNANTIDPGELRSAASFEDAIWSEFQRRDEGMLLPWRKSWDSLKLRAGETSIWAGVNGHGKSAVVTHVLAELLTHRTRCCVASMEYRTPKWLSILTRVLAGTSAPTEAYARHIARNTLPFLWTFNAAGSAKAARILEVFRYARERYDVSLFVIDNLTKCGFADDDYSGQKAFVEAVCDFDRDTGSHTMIVAHMRKGEDESKPNGKMAVKGSGGITDMVDTVVEVWRNKPREKAIARSAELGEPVPEKYRDQPDTLLLCHKQRENGLEPVVRLWFDADSGQFFGSPQHSRRPLVPYTAAAAA